MHTTQNIYYKYLCYLFLHLAPLIRNEMWGLLYQLELRLHIHEISQCRSHRWMLLTKWLLLNCQVFLIHFQSASYLFLDKYQPNIAVSVMVLDIPWMRQAKPQTSHVISHVPEKNVTNNRQPTYADIVRKAKQTNVRVWMDIGQDMEDTFSTI